MKTDVDTFKIETYSDAFGIAFAILLGLIIVTAWTSYDQTSDHVRQEVNYLSDLYQQSNYMDEQAREELRQNLRNYVNTVIDKEWALLRQGKYDKKADEYLFHNFHILYKYPPMNKTEEEVHSQIIKMSTNLIDTRRLRVLNAASSLPPIMWVILISSNLIAFLILGLAVPGPLSLHVTLQGLYAIGTGLMILLVIMLDRPFYDSGGGITDEPFRKIFYEWNQKENQDKSDGKKMIDEDHISLNLYLSKSYV